LARVGESNKFIQVITGTRQIGKTTMVEQLIDKLTNPVHYASSDGVPSSSAIWIEQQWETARIRLKASQAKWGLLVLDEIQKINRWSETVKKEWDKDRRNKLCLNVILLGSSTLLISKGLTESLTGRFELITLPHWSFEEMKEAFGYNANQFVWFGGYPGAAVLIDDEKRWRDYMLDSIIETTVSKDILSLSNVQKPALLKKLFELGCTYSGQILSYNKILGQLSDAGNTTTLAHYQTLLDNVWFLSGLQKFSKSNTSVRSSIPKWIVYNTSFLSIYSGSTMESAVNSIDIWGRHVESAIGAYLINECRVNGINLYYWREGNDEVDFVIEKNKRIICIEVKTGKLKLHRGIEEFKKRYKPFKSILISNDSLMWQDFLGINLNSLFD
jgi:predicted AAA+ superfamily ATPase